jgi:hypothetical protein
MGLFEAQGTLAKAHKDLVTRWHISKISWHDVQAQRVEKESLEPLERDLRQVCDAIDTMAQLVAAARRECGEEFL